MKENTRAMNVIRKLLSPRHDIVMEAYERTAERLVPLLSKGNVRLQLGRYATRSDIDKMRKKAVAHAV